VRFLAAASAIAVPCDGDVITAPVRQSLFKSRRKSFERILTLPGARRNYGRDQFDLWFGSFRR